MRRYTLAQVRGFMAAIDRSCRSRLREQLLVLRASQADDKGFRRALKELDD